MDLYGDLPLASSKDEKGAGVIPAIIPSLNLVNQSTSTLYGDIQGSANKKSNLNQSHGAKEKPAVVKPQLSPFIPNAVMLPASLSTSRARSQVTSQPAVKVSKKVISKSIHQVQQPIKQIPEEENLQESKEHMQTFAEMQLTIQDEYDPARPNDYEELCEERLNHRKQLQMRRDLKRRQEEQDETRKKELKEIEQGSFKAVKPVAPGTGRGRGLTMPAWMTQSLPKEEISEEENYTKTSISPGQFDDAIINIPSSKVLLLVNMVGPGQADDDLLEEVKEECASKYGPVKKCKIYEIEEKDIIPEEAVRIFVQFQEEKDSKKAWNALNGRFFGGRKVKAVFYDEEKFKRGKLFP